MKAVFDLIIIGSGPAGYTAAIYAGRAGLKSVLFTGSMPGGQLTGTSVVENFPGFPDGILGPVLMSNMATQAEKFGTTIKAQEVTQVDFSRSPFKIQTTDGQEFQSKSVIVATGSSARWLGIESEKRFRGRGISTCATCDGPLYRDKKVVVIGGGDAAMEEALYLAKFCQEVVVIHRRDKFRASQIMQQRVRNNSRIKLIMSAQVKEFLGDEVLQSVVIQDVNSGQQQELSVDGAFLAIGHQPNTAIFKPFIPTDERGYFQVERPPMTNIEGVFIAGDVADSRYRQAITAAGSGCQAAIEAEKYLSKEGL